MIILTLSVSQGQQRLPNKEKIIHNYHKIISSLTTGLMMNGDERLVDRFHCTSDFPYMYFITLN